MYTKLRVKVKFGLAPLCLINNCNISAKAKGIYLYIQSKPDGWNFSADRISNDFKEQVDSIRSGLKELEDGGYLQRIKRQNDKGRWIWEYVLHDSPQTKIKDSPSLDSPSLDFPSMDNPSLENRVNNSKIDYSNKEIEKKDEDEERKEKKQLPSPSTTISDDLIKKLEAATGSLLQAEQILSQNLTKERIISIVERNEVMTYFEYFDYFQKMDSLTMENTARSRSEDVRTFNKNMNAFCSSIVKSQKIDEYTSKKNFWMHFNNFINKIKTKR